MVSDDGAANVPSQEQVEEWSSMRIFGIIWFVVNVVSVTALYYMANRRRSSQLEKERNNPSEAAPGLGPQEPERNPCIILVEEGNIQRETSHSDDGASELTHVSSLE